jgi:eukaryotic-like serine/threonine-protein kinase
MAEKAKPEAPATRQDEERLAHALISRGLVTREEVQECRAGAAGVGPEALLARLVSAGLLTTNQAQRARGELKTLLGEQIPGFILMEKVGQGAMGTVFKARQVSLNRVVAVKVLQPKLAANTTLLESLKREAHTAARLSHNNIVQAIDVGSAGPLHYFIMEFVEGKTIRQELDAGKIYEEKEAVEIVLQIAQALQHAHKRGLIHRDIKPANIVMTAEGIAKLADLGMARQTDDALQNRKERGLAIGTPFYMAPEQITGKEDIDGRADLYALGATFYHMVTGQTPFKGKDVDGVLRAHLDQTLTPPDHLNDKLSSGLGELVEVLMAKDRNQRYRSADDLIIDLECLLAGEPPRLARKKIEASTLAGLTEGESDEEGGGKEPSNEMTRIWFAVLGGCLVLSVLFNIILLIRGRG